MESKHFMKVYDISDITKNNLKQEDTTIGFEISFESIAKSLIEMEENKIMAYLYKKYKDSSVSKVYVLSEKDFEKYLKDTLPKWLGKEN